MVAITMTQRNMSKDTYSYSSLCRSLLLYKTSFIVLTCVSTLQLSPIPSAKVLDLKDLKFDDFKLLDDQMLTAAIRMFTEFEFIKTYHIKYEVCFCVFLSVN